MAKDKTGPSAAAQTGTDAPPVVQPPRYVSAGFYLRSRPYPAGVPLDNLPDADLRELIASGQAQPVAVTEPAPVATTEE